MSKLRRQPGLARNSHESTLSRITTDPNILDTMWEKVTGTQRTALAVLLGASALLPGCFSNYRGDCGRDPEQDCFWEGNGGSTTTNTVSGGGTGGMSTITTTETGGGGTGGTSGTTETTGGTGGITETTTSTSTTTTTSTETCPPAAVVGAGANLLVGGVYTTFYPNGTKNINASGAGIPPEQVNAANLGAEYDLVVGYKQAGKTVSVTGADVKCFTVETPNGCDPETEACQKSAIDHLCDVTSKAADNCSQPASNNKVLVVHRRKQ